MQHTTNRRIRAFREKGCHAIYLYSFAAIMSLSLTTIDFHRRNLRRKLNLRNSRINLRTHLISLRQ